MARHHVEGPWNDARHLCMRLCSGLPGTTRVRKMANPTSTQDGKVPSTWAPRGSRHTNGPGTLETVPENTCGSDQACPVQHPVCPQLIITDKVSSLPILGSAHFSRLLNLIGTLGLIGLSLGPCHKPQQLCFVVKCLRCVEIVSPSGRWIPQC